jgi:hypothetical protein
MLAAFDASSALSFEVFERDTAGRRDAVPVGHQAAGDLLAIWNKSAADSHRVAHAGVVIVLSARRRG